MVFFLLIGDKIYRSSQVCSQASNIFGSTLFESLKSPRNRNLTLIVPLSTEPGIEIITPQCVSGTKCSRHGKLSDSRSQSNATRASSVCMLSRSRLLLSLRHFHCHFVQPRILARVSCPPPPGIILTAERTIGDRSGYCSARYSEVQPLAAVGAID